MDQYDECLRELLDEDPHHRDYDDVFQDLVLESLLDEDPSQRDYDDVLEDPNLPDLIEDDDDYGAEDLFRDTDDERDPLPAAPPAASANRSMERAWE